MRLIPARLDYDRTATWQGMPAGKRDISRDGEVRRPDPSKWEKPHDHGEGKHAGELEDDAKDDPASDDE